MFMMSHSRKPFGEIYMKNIILILAICLSVFNLSACSEESDSQKSTSSKDDSGLTGERFFDSASTKIMLHNEGMNRKRANCMVTYITADGQIGLGEINQMHLTSKTMPQNAERLNKAYSASMQNCQ